MTQRRNSVTQDRDTLARARSLRSKSRCHGGHNGRDSAASDRDSDTRLEPVVTITVEPWPLYSNDGRGPAWRVFVDSPKFRGWLIYSKRLQRFASSTSLLSMRLKSPRDHARALSLVRQAVLSHREQMITDPRFSAIAAGLSREPFADPHPDPHTLAADAERAEMHRSAAAAAIARHQAGQFVDPVHLEWCRAIVATFKPLQRPLGTGAPA